MMAVWLAVAIIFGVILVGVLLYFLLRDRSSFGKLKSKFNNTTENLDDVGGILLNNFGPEWFQAMLKHGEVSLQDTAVCAHVNRHTCTAYSYMRRDLLPMLFMFPGVESSVPCGIILDTKKVWPRITLMATVDGDTNNRTCCTNESGSAILTRSPWSANATDLCIYNSMTAQANAGKIPKDWLGPKNYAVYIPTKDTGATGGTCATSCKGDRTCMYNNSGGNINQWLMNSSQDCINGDYADCFTFRLAQDSEVPAEIKNAVPTTFGNQKLDGFLIQGAGDCKSCKKPFLCVFKDAPPGSKTTSAERTHSRVGKQFHTAAATKAMMTNRTRENFVSPEDKYKIVQEADRYATYIGKDGKGFQVTTTPTMKIGDIAITQCRFERDDWNKWIKVLKQYYRDLAGLVRWDNSMVDDFNYQLANPCSPSYFENEVNLYIDPDTSSDEYKKQNKIWQDAIIGFYYTASTCDEQLAPLEGIPTKGQWGGCEYSGVEDRCNGFFNMDTASRKKWESDRIAMSRKLVHQVADMFAKNQKRKVPVYKCTADSNAFPNWNSLQKAFSEEVELSDYLKEDTDYKHN